MPSFKGRDLLVKIGDGADTETFTTLGAARAAQMSINNNPIDATSLADDGVQVLVADAGVQTLQVTLDGVFKDAGAEERLRACAFNRTAARFLLCFGNGDTYEAQFVVQDYNRAGNYDGLEAFSVTLIRSGAGIFTPAA